MATQQKYTSTAIALHWLMAILLFILFGLGWYMEDLPLGTPERSQFFSLHKSIGLTVALLAVIRLCWRYSHAPPELPEYVSGVKRRLATWTHNLLYIAIIVQPLSGYISSSFSGYKTKLWGVPLPHWGWKSPPLNELFTSVHAASSIVLICLILLHIAGAVVHIYRGEKELVRRMMPGGGKDGQ